MVQVYLDESERDNIFVLAGWMAGDEQWNKFRAEWSNALHTFTTGQPFKMTDAANDWSEPLQKERLGLLTILVTENTRSSVMVGVDKVALKEIFAGAELPFYDPYFFCVWFSMIFCLGEGSFLLDPAETVEFIFDRGRREREIDKAFDEFVHHAPEKARKLIRGRPRFEDDATSIPIQAADLLAWWARRCLEQSRDRLPQPTLPTGFDKYMGWQAKHFFNRSRLLELKDLARLAPRS